MSNITELSAEANITNESLDFKASFLRDIKGNVTLQEYSNNRLKLSNDVIYEIRKLDSKNDSSEKYAIFRNDVKIASNIIRNSNPSALFVANDDFFNYVPQMSIVNTNWVYTDGTKKSIESCSYLVGDKTNYDLQGGMIQTYGTEIREIRYHSNDDEEKIKSQYVVSGDKAYVLDNMFHKYSQGIAGYGTTPDSTIEYSVGDEIPIEVTDLYAIWHNLVGVVNITFYSNSGTFGTGASSLTTNSITYDVKSMSADITTSIKEGKYVIPTLSGKVFSGWTLTPDGSGKIYKSQNSISEVLVDGISLYAKYVSRPTAIYLNGQDFNSKIKQLAGNSGATHATEDINIKNIKWSSTEPTDAHKLTENTVSDSNSSTPIYAWFENNTIYLWSQAEDIRLSSNAFGLLRNLHALEEIDLANDMHIIDTISCTNMSSMFQNDEKLRTLHIDSLSTESASDISWMFAGCSTLTSLDISNLKTSSVQNMSGLFSGLENITQLDLYHLNTSNVNNMSSMFKGMTTIKNLDLSNFVTTNTTRMDSMFYNCKKLKTVNLSSFNTYNVTNLDSFLYYCYDLENVDLSTFNTLHCTNYKNMFTNDSSLRTIYASNNFVVSNSANVDYMFNNCSRLVGGSGTAWKNLSNYRTYAHIDGGTSNPGYFTNKNTSPTEDIPENSIYQKYLDGVLSKGDYIKYNSHLDQKSVTIPKSKTGLTAQTLTSSIPSEMDWRVLYIDEDEKIVYITPENFRSDSKGVKLRTGSLDSYLNSKDILDTVADSLYTSDTLNTPARSITVEDIIDAFNISATPVIERYAYYPDGASIVEGDTYEYNSHLYTKKVHNENGPYLLEADGGGLQRSGTTAEGNSYSYRVPQENDPVFITSMYYQINVPGGQDIWLSNENFYVANKAVKLNNSHVQYSILSASSNRLEYGDMLFSSNGDEDESDCYVRPVVALNTSILLDDDDNQYSTPSQKGQNAENAWIITK